jgi:hypothetical protein
MLTHLTPEQEEGLAVVRDEWIAIGLLTEPADKPEAEAGVAEAYIAADLKPPTQVIWTASPLAGAIEAHKLSVDNPNLDDSEVPKSAIMDQVYRACYGQHHAGWLAFYDYFTRYTDVTGGERLSGAIRVAKAAGWWWPLETAVVISDRPAELHRDGQSRLHAENGPAIRYRDGFSVYSWHGTRVPADLIESNWSVQQIMEESNAEIRRCAIEKLGWDVFVEASGLEKVASAPDPGNDPFTLDLYDLPQGLRGMYAESARILLAVNGTVERDGSRRRYGLPVPAHHTDPVAAAAELYGWTVDEYRQLEVRK